MLSQNAKTLILGYGLLLLTTNAEAVSCPQASFAELQAKTRETGKVNLVFFASWCTSCQSHLLAKRDGKTIFVAAFDEPARAEKVLKALAIEGPCFTSDDTASHLGVKAVPADRVIELGQK